MLNSLPYLAVFMIRILSGYEKEEMPDPGFFSFPPGAKENR